MSRPFVDIFGLGGGEVEIEIRKIAVDAVRHGYGVVPIEPLSKLPVCTLNSQELKKAGSDHPCGVHHVITDEKVANRVFARLQKNMPDGLRLNLAIVAGPSRLITIDADTAEAVAAFGEVWSGFPNVRTPGVQRDGVWKHSDGGHWHFVVPEGVELPAYPSTMKGEGGWDVRWGMQYALVPPSVRAEGVYTAHGDIPEAPTELLDLILTYSMRRNAERTDLANRFVNDTVAHWSIVTSWDDLLEPDGWSNTGKFDRACGCPVWEKPGGGTSSRRSAIAHDVGCEHSVYANVEGHGPLHWFTEDPPAGLQAYREAHSGSTTVTKLQYVAWMHYDGDEFVAKAALGLGYSDDDIDAWLASSSTSSPSNSPLPPSSPEPEASGAEPERSERAEGSASTSASADSLELDDGEEARLAEPNGGGDLLSRIKARLAEKGVPENIAKDIVRKVTDTLITNAARQVVKDVSRSRPPEILWGSPSDVVPPQCLFMPMLEPIPGVGLVSILPDGFVSTVFGRSSSGKSWLAVYTARDAVERLGKRTLYVDGEDSHQGWFSRLALVGADITDPRYGYMGIEMWDESDIEAIATSGADLTIVDSINAVVSLDSEGRSSNDDDVIRKVVNTMRLWPGTKLFIDHATEKARDGEETTTALGASAKKAAPDGVVLRLDKLTDWRKGKGGRSRLLIGKDRHGVVDVTALASDPHGFTPIAELVMLVSDQGTHTLRLDQSIVEAPSTPDEVEADERSVYLARLDELVAIVAKVPSQFTKADLKVKAAALGIDVSSFDSDLLDLTTSWDARPRLWFDGTKLTNIRKESQ